MFNKNTEEEFIEEKKKSKINYLSLLMHSLYTLLAVFVAKYFLSLGVIPISGWVLTVVVWGIDTVLMFNTYLLLALLLGYAIALVLVYFLGVVTLIGAIFVMIKKGVAK